MKAIQCQCCLACVLYAASMITHLQAAETMATACISEFMADNQHGLKDDDGERSGWIEIYNAGGATLNLAGWFLTDSPTNLTKWQLPSVSLLPEKYLVVFASGKDRARDRVHLHTNFRLNARGGYLALVDHATNIISEFAAYTEQSADTSYGRVPGELATVGRFLHPTPGKPNATHGPGFAPEVMFSRPSGTVSASVGIQLSCGLSRAAIHYTTDGTLPSRRSPVYRGPLTVTKTMHLRARAYEEGLLPGPPHSETYLFLHSSLQTFTSNLPVLVMDTLGQDLPNSSRDSFAHLSFFEPVTGRTSLTNSPSLTTRAGCHVRGSSTMDLPKSSFALHFLDEFNQEQHHSVLGLPADSDWVLYGPNRYEPVMIHNPFVHQLSRDLGRYSPRTRFLEVYLVKSSGPVTRRQYQGIYVLEEKIKVGKHRVDIDRLGPADVKRPEVTGGYLLKIDRLGPNEAGFWVGDASMVYVEPKERVISLPERAPQRQFLTTYFTDFERALHGPNWKDPVLGYRAYIDVNSWIDYHVLEVLSGNVDALVFSTYFYKPRNGKLVFGPHWDFDRALGSTDGRDDDPRRWNTGRFFGGAWWAHLFRDPDFWQLWVDRWQELRQKQFSREHLNALIDRLTDELREAQPREAERWDLQPRGGSYQSEIDLMKDWLSNRVDFIDEQLVPKPGVSAPTGPIAPGSVVTLTIPNHSTVYYTLDGSDPRLSQGAISSSALIYSGPIRLNADARLVARARDPAKRQIGGPRVSTPWSGPVTATFKLTPP
jgi:CotH kinase protein/Lamin Tail Domain/Chitobiase/beta-hexosaminidase C-terminal domain